MSQKNITKLIRRSLELNIPATERKLVAFIERKVRQAGADGAVVGLSGGVDSSVVAALCKKALGKTNVLGVCMPEAGVTDPRDIADARDVSNKLDITFRIVDITPAVRGIRQNLSDFRVGARIPAANIKPRVRMTILYYYANLLNRLVVGGGNRSELRAGYFTKFGDGAVDLLPIGCLYKTQVRQLAAHLNVPKQIIEKVPSAGLWRGQTDEKELELPYENLDLIYAGLDLGLEPDVIVKAAGVEINKVKHFIEREHRVAHKLNMPEISEL
jgi:NAD+ synthase